MTGRKRLAEAVKEATNGSSEAVDEIFESCYDELRGRAHRFLAKERANHSLQTTEIVHEAYVRLVDGTQLDWINRAHFFAIAARVMRRVLVDHARRRQSQKRGGRARRVPFTTCLNVPTKPPTIIDIVALDTALSRLHDEMPEKARIVEMRFFGGMTHDEIGQVLGMPARTVSRHAAYAQTRLYEMMRDS